MLQNHLSGGGRRLSDASHIARNAQPLNTASGGALLAHLRRRIFASLLVILACLGTTPAWANPLLLVDAEHHGIVGGHRLDVDRRRGLHPVGRRLVQRLVTGMGSARQQGEREGRQNDTQEDPPGIWWKSNARSGAPASHAGELSVQF